MRVNSRVFSERQDMLGNIQISNCPSQLRRIAENIVNMATQLDYSFPDYHTITELDKRLMVDYWKNYDGLKFDSVEAIVGFDKWFIKSATHPDLITRARRWLIEHNYLIIKPDVAERAYEAESKFSKSIRG